MSGVDWIAVGFLAVLVTLLVWWLVGEVQGK